VKGLGAVIGIIIALIVVVAVALPVTISVIQPYGTLTAVVNESYIAENGTYNTTAYNPVDLNPNHLDDSCGVTTNEVAFINTTGSAANCLNETTNYAWQAKDASAGTANGTVYWTNIPASWNSSNAVGHAANKVVAALKLTYNYQTADYRSTGIAGRAILNNLPLFIIIFGFLLLAGLITSRLR
jgi:hypothetical protein